MYAATGLPSSLSIDPSTGIISGTPSVTATYTVVVTATDPQSASVSSSFVLNVVPVPVVSGNPLDLSIPKVDVSRRTTEPGERVRYVTILRNDGNQTATGTMIQVQMPEGFVYSTDNSQTTDTRSFVWAQTPTSPGITYDVETNQVMIPVPSIGAGEQKVMFFYGLVPTTKGRHYAYWQILRTDQSDPDSQAGNGFCNGEDDTQSIDTRVLIPTNEGIDLELVDMIAISKASPAQNDEVAFTVTAHNTVGPNVGTNVLTKLTLPASLSFTSAVTPGVSYNAETREVAYNAATIGIGQTSPFTFSARVLAAAGSTVTLRAEIKSADQDDYDSVYDNIQCNNYDDDQASVTFTVTGVASTTQPTTGGPLTLIQPLYNCQTGAITFRTQGGDGSPIYFNAVGIVAYSTVASYTVEAAIRNDSNSQPLAINATQGNTTVHYTFDFRGYCAGNPPVTEQPAPTQPTSPTMTQPVQSTTAAAGKLTVRVASYNCATGVLSLTTTGGDGTAVLFNCPGVVANSTATSYTIEAAIRNDNNSQPLNINATQSGQTVTVVFDFKGYCRSTRAISAEAEPELQVTVLGNPTTSEAAEVLIQGAAGKPVQLRLTNTQGFVVGEQGVGSAGESEQQRVQLGRTAGIYLLQVTTPTQTKTVKIMKQ